MTFSDWLAGQLRDHRMTCADLGQRLGVMERVVVAWKCGQSIPVPYLRREVARTFGVLLSEVPVW